MIDVSMRSLQKKLTGQEQQIKHLTQMWGVETSPLEEQALFKRMQDLFAARSVWEQLDAVERRCLFEALIAPNRDKGMPCDRLRTKVKLSPDEFEHVLTRLKNRWLLDEEEVLAPSSSKAKRVQPLSLLPVRTVFVYRECSQSLYITGRELFISYGDRSTMELSRLIERPREELQTLASRCHLSYLDTRQITRPLDLQQQISEELAQSWIVFDLLHHLDTTTQQLFTWLCCERNGKASMPEVREYLAARQYKHESIHVLLRSLEEYALAFDTLSPHEGRILFIPATLLAVIKHLMLECAADEQYYAFFPLPAVPAIRRESQPILLYDLATVAGCSYQYVIEPTKEGKIPKRLVVKIRPQLQGMPRVESMQEELYTDQLFRMAKDLGILCLSSDGEEKARYRPGPYLSQQWKQFTLVGQARNVLAQWRKTSSWCDVSFDGKLIYSSSSSTARNTLLAALSQCLPEHWYDINSLLFFIWKQQPLYPYTPSERSAKKLSMHKRWEQWAQREGSVYRALLFSTLSELGLIALGYTTEPSTDEVHPPEAFLVTSFGATVLTDPSANHYEDPRTVADQKVLIVQPNYDIIVRQPIMSILYALLAFAQAIHIGPASTFKLTQTALLRGLEAAGGGQHAEQILAFLQQHCEHEFPQNVAYTIKEDWLKTYKEATLTDMTLIELLGEHVEDDFQRVVAELNCTEVRKLGPALFAVIRGDVSFFELKKRLVKAGVVVHGKPAASPKKW